MLRAPGGTIFFTADLLVQGVHFNLDWTSPQDLGWKAIAVNCSDVAAMGGTPRRALVSLCVPPGAPLDLLEGIYAGMRECCDRFGLAVVGGDLSRAPVLVISVALLGNPAGRRVVERRGALPGHAICVTGRLGASAAGLRLLQAGPAGQAALEGRPDLRAAHLRPVPRVREAETLRRFLPSAMIDVSDGFAADLGHLCEASGLGAQIQAELLPLADLSSLPQGLHLDPVELALSGGEDYELCFTIDPGRVEAAAAEIAERTGTPVHVVGHVYEGAGMILVRDGETRTLSASGWDHLRP
ncbi:MAG: thiamine-phosphate kinase [Actinomycetota bacterium]